MTALWIALAVAVAFAAGACVSGVVAESRRQRHRRDLWLARYDEWLRIAYPNGGVYRGRRIPPPPWRMAELVAKYGPPPRMEVG